jgi:hypothetical protein
VADNFSTHNKQAEKKSRRAEIPATSAFLGNQ